MFRDEIIKCSLIFCVCVHDEGICKTCSSSSDCITLLSFLWPPLMFYLQT